ncbi:MAG: S24/S26 family peptidase [Clostridia bacterium]|nr:S24/S26 family peptidase [Clostridia bacterium]
MNEKSIKILDSNIDGQTLVNLLADGCPFPLIVTGSSMMPLLKPERDSVWLQKSDSVQRGRILFFRRNNGMFVLHRVRRVLPDGSFIVNGDAQKWVETVHPAQAVAVVTQIVRKDKTIRWDHPMLRLWYMLWYPTRPIRPFLFRMYAKFSEFLHSIRH